MRYQVVAVHAFGKKWNPVICCFTVPHRAIYRKWALAGKRFVLAGSCFYFLVSLYLK